MIVRMRDGIYNDILNIQCHKISYLAALQHTHKTYIAFTTSPLPLSQGDFKITKTIYLFKMWIQRVPHPCSLTPKRVNTMIKTKTFWLMRVLWIFLHPPPPDLSAMQ